VLVPSADHIILWFLLNTATDSFGPRYVNFPYATWTLFENVLSFRMFPPEVIRPSPRCFLPMASQNSLAFFLVFWQLFFGILCSFFVLFTRLPDWTIIFSAPFAWFLGLPPPLSSKLTRDFPSRDEASYETLFTPFLPYFVSRLFFVSFVSPVPLIPSNSETAPFPSCTLLIPF